MMTYALYSPLWLLFGGRAILRTAVLWGGEEHGLGWGWAEGQNWPSSLQVGSEALSRVPGR